MFPGLGFGEILVIMLIVLLVFGPKKMPELARGIGRAFNEFKRAAEDVRRELDVDNLDVTSYEPPANTAYHQKQEALQPGEPFDDDELESGEQEGESPKPKEKKENETD